MVVDRTGQDPEGDALDRFALGFGWLFEGRDGAPAGRAATDTAHPTGGANAPYALLVQLKGCETGRSARPYSPLALATISSETFLGTSP